MNLFRRKQKTEERAIDEILPSKMKLGTTLFTDVFQFMLNDDFVFKFDIDSFIVESMSEYRMHGTNFINLYLKSEDETIQFLMIELKEDNSVEKIVFFYEYDDVEPDDDEGWDQWLNDENGYIGAEEFTIEDDGLDKTFINYYDKGRIEFEETLFNESGEEIDSYNSMMSLYSRDVDHSNEYVYLSKVETEEEAFISISIGVEISLNDLK